MIHTESSDCEVYAEIGTCPHILPESFWQQAVAEVINPLVAAYNDVVATVRKAGVKDSAWQERWRVRD